MFIQALLYLVMATDLSATSPDPFPQTNDRFREVKGNPSAWKNKSVAFEGQVVRKERGLHNKLYFKMRMLSATQDELWVGSLFDFDTVRLDMNHTARVLGYFTSLHGGDPMGMINRDGYHLIGFCLVNVSTSEALFFPGAMKQCEGWQHGKLP
jgi:hypothetical protein